MPLDLIVIGCGPAGYKAAAGAARLGATVAVVERGTPGGNCLNEGCIPTRALLHPAMLIEDCNALAGRGLVGSPRADFAAAVRHKDAVVAALRDGLPGAMRRLGIRMLRGAAKLEAPSRVRVGNGEVLEAPARRGRHRLAPAAAARVPVRRPGGAVSSREFFSSLNRLPESVLCVGGGAVGVEAAYLARQYGARVTIVEREPRLLPAARVPEHVADLLEARLERLGVEVRTGAAGRGLPRGGEPRAGQLRRRQRGRLRPGAGGGGARAEQRRARPGRDRRAPQRRGTGSHRRLPRDRRCRRVRRGRRARRADDRQRGAVRRQAGGGERARRRAPARELLQGPVRGELGARDRHRRPVGGAGRERGLRPARRAQQLRRLGQGARAARLRRLHRGGARPRDRASCWAAASSAPKRASRSCCLAPPASRCAACGSSRT